LEGGGQLRYLVCLNDAGLHIASGISARLKIVDI
jgi:hypothetical protein